MHFNPPPIPLLPREGYLLLPFHKNPSLYMPAIEIYSGKKVHATNHNFWPNSSRYQKVQEKRPLLKSNFKGGHSSCIFWYLELFCQKLRFLVAQFFLVFRLIFWGAFIPPMENNRPQVLYIKLTVIFPPIILKNKIEELWIFARHFFLFKLTVHFVIKGLFVFTCPKMALGLLFHF